MSLGPPANPPEPDPLPAGGVVRSPRSDRGAGPDGAGYEHLEEELGDVLFQVVFHAVLAAEQGQFALGDVARNVHDKLVARHPHVFGDVEANTPEDVSRNWEQIKQREKGQPA